MAGKGLNSLTNKENSKNEIESGHKTPQENYSVFKIGAPDTYIKDIGPYHTPRQSKHLLVHLSVTNYKKLKVWLL